MSRFDVYLAGRYGRAAELNRYADQLTEAGYNVTSRWHEGGHELTDANPDADKERFATEDCDDLYRADRLISFTEAPAEEAPGRARGGRHVEFGIAFGYGMRLVIIGPRENVFHWLPMVEQYDDWQSFKRSEGI